MKFLAALILLCSSALQAQPVETIVQRSAGGNCKSFTISSDGLLLAKINENFSVSEIEIWNTRTGHLLRVINTNTSSANLMDPIMHVRFWKGSKCIITGTVMGRHEIYDVQTGKLIKQLPLTSYVGGAFAVCEKSGVFTCLAPLSFFKNDVLLFDLFSNTIYDSLQLAFAHVSAIEFSPDGTEIGFGTEDGSFHLVELKTENEERKKRSALNVHKGAINFMQWTKDNYLLISDSLKFSLWNLKLTENANINRDTLSAGSRIVASPTEDCFFKATPSSILRLSGRREVQKRLGIAPDHIIKFTFDSIENKLYILTDNFIKLWDLNNISQVKAIPANSFLSNKFQLQTTAQKKSSFYFIPAEKACVFLDDGKLITHSIDTSAGLTQINATGINSFFVINGNQGVASSKNKITTWIDNKPVEINSSTLQQLLFNLPVQNKLVTVSDDKSLNILDLKTGAAKTIRFKSDLKCGAVSPDQKHFVVAGSELMFFNTLTYKYTVLFDSAREQIDIGYGNIKTLLRLPGSYIQLLFSYDGKKLFANNLFGQLKIWNLQTLKIDTILDIKASYMQLSPTGDRIFLSSGNQLLWMNPNTYSVEATIAFLDKGDYIVSMPDNYYKASRYGARAVAFRKGLQTSSFDQFDVIFNRPDIVTQRLGYPSKDILDVLKKAVTKRQKRMGISNEQADASNLEAPEVEVKNFTSIRSITDNPDLKFSIEARDKKNNLVRCDAYINGVPFYGRNGVDLRARLNTTDIKEITITLAATLTAGKNFIEVSCTNDKGIESPRASFEIFYSPKIIEAPTLFFIGIGAGKYKNNEYNLTYPSKDITDVAQMFKGKNLFYKNIQVTMLTDEEVTKERILKLKELLKKTKPEDQVIIYWSGHGVVNSELDYYLATFNMDFSNPSNGGMEYSDLESLLDDIPARKRLLFIDACHSGEIEKDEARLVNNTTAEGKLTAYNVKGIERKKVVNSSIVLNELFADVRRNSGANIISAAGGAEFALESDKWSNGVFTYCLIQGLRDNKADLDKNGEILISELQNYLQEKVPELTRGQQKPTSRTENLVTDSRIW